MHSQKEDGATAAAEQLVAEEAQEAAKAAAKKVKKQKAKARKQQTRSDATSVSASSPLPSMLTQLDLEPSTTLHPSSVSSPSASGSPAVANLHIEQSTAHIAALHQVANELPVEGQTAQSPIGADTALPLHAPHGGDEAPRPAAAAAGGLSAGKGATDTSRGADASFLDQLFCCPITKVAPPLCAMPPPPLPSPTCLSPACYASYLQNGKGSDATQDVRVCR